MTSHNIFPYHPKSSVLTYITYHNILLPGWDTLISVLWADIGIFNKKLALSDSTLYAWAAKFRPE